MRDVVSPVGYVLGFYVNLFVKFYSISITLWVHDCALLVVVVSVFSEINRLSSPSTVCVKP